MSLHIDCLPTGRGGLLGVASLASPNTLNALTLASVQQLDQQLRVWQADPQIVGVILRGQGSKAFCAGGDVRQLARECLASPAQVPELARQFFAEEYRLNHLLHHFGKPLLGWGHGHVLGGGMGLLQGCNRRIVCADSRLGMPETAIGLFPDVAASWFLNRLPGRLGLFLALTGSPLNARDALDLGLADYFLLDSQQDALLAGLQTLDWQQANALPGLLEQLQAEALAHCPTGQWLRRRAHIDALLDNADLAGCVTALLAQGAGDDPLLREAATRLAGACPLSLALCWQQLHRARGMSLADCLRIEYTLSQNCCRFGEFAEGVRARLLDKDQQPHWRWPTLQDVPDSVLASHFQPCWSGAHPLADLQDQP